MVNFSFKLFSWAAEGDSTYEASPLPPPNPHHPHCTFKGYDSANAPHVFKFAMKLNSARDLKLNLIKSHRRI